MIAGINLFLVSDEMMWVMGKTGRRQVDCSRVVGRQQRMSDRLDGCIVWNAHNTVFGSKRSAIFA